MNKQRILEQMKSYGVINKCCGSCLFYEILGLDKDPLLKNKQTDLNAYGRCSSKSVEVFSDEICSNFETIAGLPTEQIRNRKEPRELVADKYMQLPKIGVKKL